MEKENSKELKALLGRLQLVNLKNHEGHDGMAGMNAELKYDGVKIARLHDDAWGGEIECNAIGKVIEDANGEYIANKTLDTNRKLLDKLNTEIKNLPPWVSGIDGGEMPYFLDLVIGELEKIAYAKKDEKKGIMVSSKVGHTLIGWKVSIPTMMKKHGKDSIVANLQKDVNKLIANGETIVNGEYLQSIGVNL